MHWNVIVRSHLASQCIKTMKNLEKIIDAGRSFLKKCNKSTQFELLEILEFIRDDADACICTSLALP